MYVGRQCGLPQQFGQAAVGQLAEVVHLEEAVARVEVALHERDIGFRFALDAPDPVLVFGHRHGAAQSRKIEILRQRRLGHDENRNEEKL